MSPLATLHSQADSSSDFLLGNFDFSLPGDEFLDFRIDFRNDGFDFLESRRSELFFCNEF